MSPGNMFDNPPNLLKFPCKIPGGMRLAVFVAVALFAGCLGNTGPSKNHMDAPTPSAGSAPLPSNDVVAPSESASPPKSNASAPIPPGPMHWEGNITVGLEAGGPWATCTGPLESCDKRPFQVNGAFDLDAKLSWDLAANDLDLYLYRHSGIADELVSSDGINGPIEVSGNNQVLHYPDLPAGDYRLWVSARHAGHVNYRLDAVFS
jgi:hypothetical protein